MHASYDCIVPLTGKCLDFSYAAFVSFEPVACFWVMFMLLLFIYDVIFLAIFHIYMVFHLHDKNLQLLLCFNKNMEYQSFSLEKKNKVQTNVGVYHDNKLFNTIFPMKL